MNLMMFQLVFMFSISFIILILVMCLSKKSVNSFSSSTPFECGFTPFKNSRSAFSLQFFLLALVFLVFDIEVIILFPALSVDLNFTFSLLSSVNSFFLIVSLGLLVEWSQMSLEWLK